MSTMLRSDEEAWLSEAREEIGMDAVGLCHAVPTILERLEEERREVGRLSSLLLDRRNERDEARAERRWLAAAVIRFLDHRNDGCAPMYECICGAADAARFADRILRGCVCGGPSTHPCGPTCKYPYTDERSKEEDNG